MLKLQKITVLGILVILCGCKPAAPVTSGISQNMDTAQMRANDPTFLLFVHEIKAGKSNAKGGPFDASHAWLEIVKGWPMLGDLIGSMKEDKLSIRWTIVEKNDWPNGGYRKLVDKNTGCTVGTSWSYGRLVAADAGSEQNCSYKLWMEHKAAKDKFLKDYKTAHHIP